MSSHRRDRDYLTDISEAIQRINEYVEGLSYEDFLNDTKTHDAVLRNLQVIGEAAKRISWQTRRPSPHIPWKEMAGLRDKVVHDYFGIRFDVVWTVIDRELPQLAIDIQRLLKETR